MGVHAPELLGGAGRPTAQCDTCDDVARWLFHVKTGTAAGDEAVRLAGARGGEVAARRVPPERESLVRGAVVRMHERHGAVVCVVCAAPRMAEERGLGSDPPGGGRRRRCTAAATAESGSGGGDGAGDSESGVGRRQR